MAGTLVVAFPQYRTLKWARSIVSVLPSSGMSGSSFLALVLICAPLGFGSTLLRAETHFQTDARSLHLKEQPLEVTFRSETFDLRAQTGLKRFSTALAGELATMLVSGTRDKNYRRLRLVHDAAQRAI